MNFERVAGAKKGEDGEKRMCEDALKLFQELGTSLRQFFGLFIRLELARTRERAVVGVYPAAVETAAIVQSR